MRLLPTIAAIAMLHFSGSTALAENVDDDCAFTRVQFDAQATQEVDNDSMRATLFVETEDGSPSGASSRATRATNDTLRQLQEDSSLRVRTGNFRTFPVSDKGKITGWRSRSEILIESKDFERASAAIASASRDMQLSRIEFYVSPEMRESVESVLSDEAIAAFLAKAHRIASSFGATEFEVAEASVMNQGGNTPPRPMMAAMSSDASGRAPEFSGGTTRMRVTVSGVILIAR